MAKAEQEALKTVDIHLTQDSESGIGIDLRDRSELSNAELALLRLGMVSYQFYQVNC
jgi:F-box and WD-40 domain protein 1/11